MASSLVIALTAALPFLLTRRPVGYWPGIIIGLLLLTRPDTGILVALIFVHWLATRRFRIAAINAAAALVVCAPWLIYAWHTFGDVVPASLRAKLAYAWYAGHFGLGIFVDCCLCGQWIVAIGWVVLAAAGALYLVRRERDLTPLALWPLVYWAVMTARAPNFAWYYAPPLWVLWALAFLGAHDLGKHLPRLRWTPAATIAAILVTVSILGVLSPISGDVRHVPLSRIGKYLARNTPPDASVAAFEVGKVAYLSNRRIIDLCGLTSPELLPMLTAADTEAGRLPLLIRHCKPDYIAAMSHHEAIYRRYGYRLVWRTPIPMHPEAYYGVYQSRNRQQDAVRRMRRDHY